MTFFGLQETPIKLQLQLKPGGTESRLVGRDC